MIAMKAFRPAILTLLRRTAVVALVVFNSTSLAATTTPIANTESTTTDGTASSSAFQLSVTSGQLANALTTASDIELSLALAPQESHLGLDASIYTVIVAGGQYYKLAADGSYVPWDGSIEDLTPFTTGQTLQSTNQFTLLDGKMAAPGSYLYFVAYGVEGESRLLYTDTPAQIMVAESKTPPDETSSQAAETFEAQIENDVVQAQCIDCHVEGGFARNSSLLFQRTNTASALNNFSALTAFVEEKGAELLLAKVSGGEGHSGGMQLSKDSEGYKAFEKVLGEIAELDNTVYYAFGQTSEQPSPRQASFLTEVTLEPRQATLRRAALMLQGRLPTAAEERSVTSDATLRDALRGFMRGAAFREFVVTGVNDRLLTEGAQFAISDTLPNFIELHQARVALQMDDDPDNDFDLYRSVQPSARRASGELFAYIIENDRDYGEILTADYMMMNPTLDKWLDGSAVFSADDGADVYKPAKIKGYYQSPALKETVKRVNSNSSYEIIGEPLENYPHSGVLSDFAFLSRYPTTATNRNRARARWVLYHFLGIDVEKSSQRPTDEAALTDKNNPTMNNPNCTVCHALLDPVAGAFQNWGEFNFYLHHATDELDQFYKWPEDGSKSLYRKGDRWYRDMRSPGLFGEAIKERDFTLRALGERIIQEEAFLEASAAFWWSSIFGKPLLDRPAVETDQGYLDKYAAYSAQQQSIEGFSAALSSRMNAKDMFVEMMMSPWFAAEATASYAFDGAQFESQFGNKQLLSPEQLARKTRTLTGVSWRSYNRPSGEFNSSYDNLGVLLGGIDSEAVTTRATELTPAITAILMTHATEAACPAVVRQFATPRPERSLFTLVEENTLPLLMAESSLDVTSQSKAELQKSAFKAKLTAGKRKFRVKFVNPHCDWTGTDCLEQRILYIDSLALTSPSGKRTEIRGNDPRFTTTINKDNGFRDCKLEWEGHAKCYNGTLSIELDIVEAGEFTIESTMSGQQAPSKAESVKALITIEAAGTALDSSTPNAVAIREQISELFSVLHGTNYGPKSDQVAAVYEIFVAAHSISGEAHNGMFHQCDLWKDGMIYDDFLTQKQLDEFRYANPGEDWFQEDWSKRKPYEDAFRSDRFGSKYAWTAVMMYMLSHYDYLHE